jgi:hypothetical protein
VAACRLGARSGDYGGSRNGLSLVRVTRLDTLAGRVRALSLRARQRTWQGDGSAAATGGREMACGDGRDATEYGIWAALVCYYFAIWEA